jgi:4-diphosphocytidyl-2C-methyl-D-erythritol kinase
MDRLASVAAGIGRTRLLLARRTALGEGRGERITPLPDGPEAWLVVLAPLISLAEKTRRMYGALRPGDFTDGSMTHRLADRLREGQPVRASDLHNAFERAAGEMFEGLGTYREAILRAGADAVHLAGGAGVFSLRLAGGSGGVAGKLGTLAGGRS